MEEQQNQIQPEKGYFSLIRAVGSKGKYQTVVIILACILSFQNGFTSLGTPYYFAVAPYSTCPQPHTGVSKCTQYVCSLPPQQRSVYLQPQINQLHTLGTQFGDYHCEQSYVIQSAKGVYYLGGLVGFIVGGVLPDNIGRRLSLILCLVMATLGHLLVLVAPKLWVAETGMFLIGIGIQTCFNVLVVILSEVLENDHRQKIVIIFQIFFPIGGITIIIAFYLLHTWKPIFLFFCFIPLVCCLIFTYLYLQETPQFLIKRYQVQQIRQSLRFIAKLNQRQTQFDSQEIVSQENIKRMKEEYLEQINKSDKKAFTYIDLFRYKSLRKMTVLMSTIFFCINFLYYGPLMLIDQFGFDFYLNGLLIHLSDIITYAFGYNLILTLHRRKFNLIAAAISFVSAFLLLFLHSQEICIQNCWNAKVIFELIIIFVMHFFVAFKYQVLYVYTAELYPVQVVGLAFGWVSIVATIPDTLIPQMIDILDKANFPVMIVFMIVAALSFIASFLLEQTRGKPPKDKVEEIRRGQIAMDTDRQKKEVELVEEAQ